MNIPDILNLKNSQSSESYIRKHYPEFYTYINDLYQNITFKERLYKYMHPESQNTCACCGKETKFDSIKTGYRTYCSQKCANSDPCKKQKSIQSCIAKYGTTNPMKNVEVKQKLKQTFIEKYGVDNPSKSIEVQEKKKVTTREHYGVDNPLQSTEIRDQIKETCKLKYGGNSPLSSESIKQKVLSTSIDKYGGIGLSSQEIRDKTNQTKLERYGDENYSNREKAKQTKLERYGDENYSNREKAKQTKLERYGDENYNNISKCHQTKLERYGDENYSNREKSKFTCLNKYGVEHPSQSSEVMDKKKQTNLERYGVEWSCLLPQAKLSSNNSKPNKEFANKLKSHNIEFEREYAIGKYSYDFKIDNLLIEINPFSTHNSSWGAFHGAPKDKLYHINKSKYAWDNGFECIHIWDWDDVEKIINSLKPKQSIGARKCIIKEVSKDDCKIFLNKYHFQNSCNGQTVRLGLYYNDELIEIMTFGKPRYNKKYEWELLRLCTKFEYVVSGGANKLLNHFISTYNPKSIISYCDNSKFDGGVYERLGFKLKTKSQPSKHWWNGKIHITDNLLRQRGFDQLFNTDYGKGTSNDELMLVHKFVEIYDCGQSTFVFKNNSICI